MKYCKCHIFWIRKKGEGCHKCGLPMKPIKSCFNKSEEK